jgi:hypothetical protein
VKGYLSIAMMVSTQFVRAAYSQQEVDPTGYDPTRGSDRTRLLCSLRSRERPVASQSTAPFLCRPNGIVQKLPGERGFVPPTVGKASALHAAENKPAGRLPLNGAALERTNGLVNLWWISCAGR